MSRKHLKLGPHKIRGREDVWWYEDLRGVSIIVEPQKHTTEFTIPWTTLKNALARKEQTDAI